MIAEVCVPLHISGFWAPIIRRHPIDSGSLGAGLTLAPHTCFKIIVEEGQRNRQSCTLKLNGECLDDLANLRVIDELLHSETKHANTVEVSGYSVGRLGLGYGLSAAVCIAYAAAKLLSMGHLPTLSKVGYVAHIAEVSCLTGLADVIAELRGGGLVIRTRAGGPGVGEVDVIPLSGDIVPVITPLDLGRAKVTTPRMLSEGMRLQYIEGLKAYNYFIRDPSLERFVSAAHIFSRRVGFLTRELEETLNMVLSSYLSSGCILGYFVKKALLVVLCERSCADEVCRALSGRYAGSRILELSLKGTSVVVWRK